MVAPADLDFNNATTGDWHIGTLTGKSNYPSEAQWGGRLESRTSNECSYQFYHEDGDCLYYRNRWFSNSWGSWKKNSLIKGG